MARRWKQARKVGGNSTADKQRQEAVPPTAKEKVQAARKKLGIKSRPARPPAVARGDFGWQSRW